MADIDRKYAKPQFPLLPDPVEARTTAQGFKNWQTWAEASSREAERSGDPVFRVRQLAELATALRQAAETEAALELACAKNGLFLRYMVAHGLWRGPAAEVRP